MAEGSLTHSEHFCKRLRSQAVGYWQNHWPNVWGFGNSGCRGGPEELASPSVVTSPNRGDDTILTILQPAMTHSQRPNPTKVKFSLLASSPGKTELENTPQITHLLEAPPFLSTPLCACAPARVLRGRGGEGERARFVAWKDLSCKHQNIPHIHWVTLDLGCM